MADTKIGGYFVEFSQKGHDELRARFDALKGQLEAAEKAGVSMGDMTVESLKKMADQATQFSGKSIPDLKSGYRGLGDALAEFRRNGIEAPKEMARQFDALGAAIARQQGPLSNLLDRKREALRGFGGRIGAAARRVAAHPFQHAAGAAAGVAKKGAGIAGGLMKFGALAGVGVGAGLAAKGVAGSAEFEQLGVIMERLSFIVGGALAPVLDTMTSTFTALEGPIRQVSEAIGNGLGQVMDALQPALAAIGPLLTDIAGLLTTLFKVGAPVLTFLGKLLEGLVKLAGVLVKLTDGIVGTVGKLLGISDEAPKPTRGYRQLTPASSGGPEQVQAIYSRIQTAVLKAGGRSQEEILEDIAKSSKETSEELKKDKADKSRKQSAVAE